MSRDDPRFSLNVVPRPSGGFRLRMADFGLFERRSGATYQMENSLALLAQACARFADAAGEFQSEMHESLIKYVTTPSVKLAIAREIDAITKPEDYLVTDDEVLRAMGIRQ